MRLVAVVLTLVLLTALYCFAQEKKKPEPCANAESQAEMNICWGNEYKAADARLNEAYKQFAVKLDEEEKAQLKNAQLSWLKYRDANCEFVADQYKSGSMRPMIAAICLADVTNNRTAELKVQMKERDQ